MKLQVTQENFARALNSVAKVANSRSTLPILSNVLIKTVGNRLSVAATNLDIAITHYIGSKVETEGSITIPARLTQDFVTNLPGGVVDLELEENKLHITTDQYQSSINGVQSEEFPVMPAIENGKTWLLPATELKKALQQVVIAASNDDARPTLTGVYFHTFEGNLYAVATDSYRLAEKQLSKAKTETSLLVPASALQDLLRILADYEDEVRITHDDQQILFKAGDVELVARLIEGSYPEYRKLIPRAFQTEARIKRSELMNITKVSSLFARESAGSVTIKANAKKGELSIRSIASQLGENNSSASATVSNDGEITINSRYLLDGLHALGGEEVIFAFNGKLEPCVLKEASDKPDYLHVIMPLKS